MNQVIIIPKDVLTEILAYLPVKALIRFRCISRYWYNLIKSHSFVTKHVKCDSNVSLLLWNYNLPPEKNTDEFEDDDEDQYILSFHDPDILDMTVSPNLLIPFLDEPVEGNYPSFVNLLGPINGLVCIHNVGVFTKNSSVILCNPALREFELLPQTTFACPESYYFTYPTIGFALDVDTKCYKIVHITETYESMEYDDLRGMHLTVELCNLNTNSWKIINATALSDLVFDSNSYIFFKGCSHWPVGKSSDRYSAKHTIVSFNYTTEVLELFCEFPFQPIEYEPYSVLVILNQCLALIRNGAGMPRDESRIVDIWVMKEYGVSESWTKEFVIGPYCWKHLFLSWKNEWLLVQTYDQQLIYCALHKNEVIDFMDVVIFKESLISLNEVALCRLTTTLID